MWENGHWNHIKDRYAKRTDKCSTDQLRRSRPTPLKISNFSSAFLFLFIGLSLSFLVFVLEHVKFVKGRGTVSKSANIRTILDETGTKVRTVRRRPMRIKRLERKVIKRPLLELRIYGPKTTIRQRNRFHPGGRTFSHLHLSFKLEKIS
jgi:hypothetical protein